MANEMRDRLVELLGLRLPINVPNQIGSYDTIGERTLRHDDCERLADHLIANGVIVSSYEVKYGEWIVTKTEHCWNDAEYPVEFICSECGRTVEQQEPYCHCGAKMDGGNK